MRWLGRRLVLLAIALWWPMWAQADGYTATVPIVEGDVHQARQAALKLIFLEAGQTGALNVSTRSVLIDGELSDVVRFDARYRLKHFQIRQEKQEDGYLTVSAVVEGFPIEQEACPTGLAFPRFKYQWRAPEGVSDPEAEMLFRLALQKMLDGTDSSLLFDTRSPSSESAYTLQFQLQGSSSFLVRGLKLSVSAIGQGGHVVQEWTFPFPGASLVMWQRQAVGSAVLKTRVLSDDAQAFLGALMLDLKAKLACLPAVMPVALLQGQMQTLEFSSVIPTASDLAVFFARDWPIQAGGAIDLHKIDAVLTHRVDGKKMTFQLPSHLVGQREQPEPASRALSGFLVIF